MLDGTCAQAAQRWRDASPEDKAMAREALAVVILSRALLESRTFAARFRLSQQQAEDCAQIVAMRVLGHIEAGRAIPGKEAGLIAQAARNQCLSATRLRRFEPLDDEEPPLPIEPGSSDTPALIAAAWAQMPENYREALRREHEGGPSNLERAYEAVVSRHTARQLDSMGAAELERLVRKEANRLDHHISRARAWLAERMERGP